MKTAPELLSGSWGTFGQVEASVGVVVHSHTSLLAIKEVAGLLKGDPRIRLFWIVAPDKFNADVTSYLDQLEVRVISWTEALNQTFDLVISASLHEVGQLHAKNRFAIPHGCGYGKCYPRWSWDGDGPPPVYGLDRQSLLDTMDRPIFDGIVVPHPTDFQVLIEQTPESAYSAVLGGDLIYDRLLEGKTNRKRYRADFNVRPQQTLVGMASTWGLVSLLATFPDLPVWLMRQLPADHRLVMTVHPAAWCEHSPEQVREVLRDAAEKGLDLLEPGDDWQKLVVAADVMISDHTSVTSYAAGVGVPVLLSHIADDEIAPTSLMAQLAKVSPVLDRETPILEQLNAARHARPFQHDIASSRISCTPGKSAEVIRKALYRLLELSEPRKAPRVEPMPFAEVDFWKFA